MKKKLNQMKLLIMNYPHKRTLYLGILFNVAENYLKDVSEKAFFKKTLSYLQLLVIYLIQIKKDE